MLGTLPPAPCPQTNQDLATKGVLHKAEIIDELEATIPRWVGATTVCANGSGTLQQRGLAGNQAGLQAAIPRWLQHS